MKSEHVLVAFHFKNCQKNEKFGLNAHNFTNFVSSAHF